MDHFDDVLGSSGSYASEGQPRPRTAPEMMERIIAINPSATSEFLRAFRPKNLEDYLDHLEATRLPRGTTAVLRSGWVRRADTPGIVTRSARVERSR